MFYQHKPNEDFGFYHLPYVVNFTSEKVILGLSNLQIQQGWNSIWLNLHSIFYFKFFDYKAIYLLNSYLFLFIVVFFLNYVMNNMCKTLIILSELYFFFHLFFLIFL